MFKHAQKLVLLFGVIVSCPRLWADQKPTEATEYCATRECHASYSKKKYVHKPVSEGVCKYCHKLEDAQKHTFKLFRTRKELCDSCHQEQTKGLSTFPSAVVLRPKARLGSGKYVHEPLEKGLCVDCHNPHGGDYKYFLPSAKLETLCRECHKKGESMKNAHVPVAEGKCDSCHDSHSSAFSFLLIKNPRQLCFSCHEDTKAELDRYKYVHQPVVDRECTVCHKSHEGNYFRRLVKEYTREFYASLDVSNFALCFSCHLADKVLAKETESTTDFRNGQTNLHYLHVNAPERGRTCRRCHASHASNEPKHLRETTPFGGREVPIQFDKTETGGGCSPGCHDPRVYDRIRPAVYASDKKP